MAFINCEIADWDSWAAIKADAALFTPVAREIFARHQLQWQKMQAFTNATNAVFRVGEYIIKLYAPRESGLIPDDTEKIGLRIAEECRAASPHILAEGIFADKYDFPYIILPCIKGKSARDYLYILRDEEQEDFADKMYAITGKLHRRIEPALLPNTIVENALHNERWGIFPESLRWEVRSNAETLPQEDFVFVHGDLNGGNVLIDNAGMVWLIDFGDCHIAPFWYEWPPMLFSLFQMRANMARRFIACTGLKEQRFIAILTKAIFLHDFGGDYLRQLCEKLAIPVQNMQSAADIEKALCRVWKLDSMGED